MLSKKAVKLWGCWESRVTQAQMHLLLLSLGGPSSFYSTIATSLAVAKASLFITFGISNEKCIQANIISSRI